MQDIVKVIDINNSLNLQKAGNEIKFDLQVDSRGYYMNGFLFLRSRKDFVFIYVLREQVLPFLMPFHAMNFGDSKRCSARTLSIYGESNDTCNGVRAFHLSRPFVEV